MCNPVSEPSEGSVIGFNRRKSVPLCLTPPSDNSDAQESWLAAEPEEGHTHYSLSIPSVQEAVVTPTMAKELNLHKLRIPVRLPAQGEVVVRIAWTGLCRSDACFSTGPELGYPGYNHIAGHEGIGHIVQSHDLSLLGRPVAARYLASTCQSCRYCLRDTPESCPTQKNFPKHYNGTFQQYMTVPFTSLMPLPEWVFEPNTVGASPGRYTAALCSGSTALKALRESRIQPNDVVVISGIAGAIGHLAGMMAKNVFKARVIGVDLACKTDALVLQRSDVCDSFVPAPIAQDEKSWLNFRESLFAACHDLRGTQPFLQGPDAVLVAASSFSGFVRLPEYVCDGGTIICIGVPRGGGLLSIPLAALVERQLRLQGTMMGGEAEVYQVLEYIRSGLITPFITEITLENVPEYMTRLVESRNVGKAVCRIGGPLF